MFNEWPKTLQGLSEKQKRKIDYVDTAGSTYTLYLKPPYRTDDDLAYITGDHLADIVKQLRNASIHR